MFGTSKDKIDEVYASLQTYFNIEDYRELVKYLMIEMERHPNVSIHMRQADLTQRIINIFPGMDKSSTNPTPAVKTTLAKKLGSSSKRKLL